MQFIRLYLCLYINVRSYTQRAVAVLAAKWYVLRNFCDFCVHDMYFHSQSEYERALLPQKLLNKALVHAVKVLL